MKKVAILGGAFDPITNGHIDITKQVLSESDMNEIWLMPCFKHNFDKQMTDFDIRLEMCIVALNNLDKIVVSDYESKTQNIKGTYDIFIELKKKYSDTQFHLIMGMDNALCIHDWHNSEQLIKEIPCIVIPRKTYQFTEEQWFHKKPHLFLELDVMEISSTFVRNNVQKWNKENALKFIDSPVYEIIKRRKLYEKDS